MLIFASTVYFPDLKMFKMPSSRGETIWVNAILRIVFECIAICCHIAIFDWILVKRYFMWEYGL